MPLPVLPSKLVWERIRVEFNFADQLEFNEAITSWDVEVFVSSGTDPFPNDLIATRRFQDGPRLFQWIIGGIPGNIYRLVNTAIGSTGQVYKLEKNLAILPTAFVQPPLFGVVYTTPPYPVDVLENLNTSAIFIGGLIWTPPSDDLNLNAFVTGGNLRAPLVSYSMVPESLNLSAFFTTGTLVTPIVTYSINPESFNVNAFPTNGTLVVILVTYPNYPPEGMNLNAVITGGSLV